MHKIYLYLFVARKNVRERDPEEALRQHYLPNILLLIIVVINHCLFLFSDSQRGHFLKIFGSENLLLPKDLRCVFDRVWCSKDVERERTWVLQDLSSRTTQTMLPFGCSMRGILICTFIAQHLGEAQMMAYVFFDSIAVARFIVIVFSFVVAPRHTSLPKMDLATFNNTGRGQVFAAVAVFTGLHCQRAESDGRIQLSIF